MSMYDIFAAKSITENGAMGYAETGNPVLDAYYKVGGSRRAEESSIREAFANAYAFDKKIALRYLFFARDVRGGMGERRYFRICMKYICENDPQTAEKLYSLIGEYGRYDDLVYLYENCVSARPAIVKVIRDTLDSDIISMRMGKSVSLLAKWLPSTNTSSRKTTRLATMLAEDLYPYSPRINNRKMTSIVTYRHNIVGLRKYIDVLEQKISAGHWGSVDYSSVPSKANVKYKDAFLRHDADRRIDYLNAVSAGTAKMNAGVLYPYDVIASYKNNRYGMVSTDDTLESAWKNLTDFSMSDDTIVVADGSGSMSCPVSASGKTTAWDVATSLAIYFAEKAKGEFKDKYITFSSRPQLVDLSTCTTLAQKINIAVQHNECSNTNIERTFDLILNEAIRKGMSQSELPKNVLIISDMEFDGATTTSRHSYWYDDEYTDTSNDTLFETIAEKFRSHGYDMPKCIFWNVNSRTNTIPMRTNKNGVILLSRVG